MDSAPCKDCERRYVSCHSDCDDYKNWKNEMTNHNEFIKQAKIKERRANEVMFSNVSKKRR